MTVNVHQPTRLVRVDNGWLVEYEGRSRVYEDPCDFKVPHAEAQSLLNALQAAFPEYFQTSKRGGIKAVVENNGAQFSL